MHDSETARGQNTTGFLARSHHRLRFTELSESFFARLVLAKCPDPTVNDTLDVVLSLRDLYKGAEPAQLESKLKDAIFETSEKIVESAADVISSVTGILVEPHTESVPALTYYNEHIESRLRWLLTGDKSDNKQPCIESLDVDRNASIHTFRMTVRPRQLAAILAQHLRIDLELTSILIDKFLTSSVQTPPFLPRIDYRKQVDLLLSHLDRRTSYTGERTFVITSDRLPFRWALMTWVAPGSSLFTMPTPGSSDVEDKILLPIFLEANGLLDILDIRLENDPTRYNEIVVRYAVGRPASRNVFAVWHQGMDPALRTTLNESELEVFNRVHTTLSENLVFGGKLRLERSFAEIAHWLLQKVSYCLEEPSFLKEPAQQWIEQNACRERVEMEDGFFLPFVYERLRTHFGSRVVKKPERFGGEIDIILDDIIPIELKVRRGRVSSLAEQEIDEKFRPGGQAAAYAAISRLGLVLVLDLPEGKPRTINLDSSVRVLARRFPDTADFPTCIVVFIFHCHHPRPSTAR